MSSIIINGTTVTLEPTTATWKNRTAVGDTGYGNPVYYPVREHEMTWGLMSKADFEEIFDIYEAALNQRVVCTLPTYGNDTWNFTAYTGCVVREPTAERYFSQYVTNVGLLITNIRT